MASGFVPNFPPQRSCLGNKTEAFTVNGDDADRMILASTKLPR